jgi:hypothetical protein
MPLDPPVTTARSPMRFGPAVTGHHVEEEELAADDPCLAAGRGSGQGHYHVRGRHQLGDPVGEAERRDLKAAAGQLPEPSLDGPLAPGHGQHVHAGIGEGGHAVG